MEDESMDKFHTRLRKIASNYNFNNNDEEIRNQIIQNCRSHQLRMKALQESPSLNSLLTMARSYEMAEIQAKEMEEGQDQQHVNATKQKKKGRTITTKTKTCSRCGGPFPHESDCPALGKKCSKCSKMNHFSKCCRTKIDHARSNDRSDDENNSNNDESSSESI